MSATADEGQEITDAEIMAVLSMLEPGQAIAELKRRGLARRDIVFALAEGALVGADNNTEAAARMLAMAEDLNAGPERDEGALALTEYARARIFVHQGELVQAEMHLRQAQERWAGVGAVAWLTRSHLGMTQVLAMQGRYSEAETAARAAIASMEQEGNGKPGTALRLATAYRNLATLLLYLERHSEALNQFDAADVCLGRAVDEKEDGATRREQAHIALNRASALTFLDRPDDAEEALETAVRLFEQGGDLLNRGRALTNLGRLCLRTGQYAAALEAFDRAAKDLIGDLPAEAVPELERLRQADELLLEHATAYLALNLLPEAAGALERCEALFRKAEQPYELGQTLYSKGLARLLAGDIAGSRRALEEALYHFGTLGNRFWTNRAEVALATLALRERNAAGADAHLQKLFGGMAASGSAESLTWDTGGLADARLLHLSVLLVMGDVAGAQEEANTVARLIGDDGHFGRDAAPLPHLLLRLEYARGRIDLAAGRPDQAQRHFRRGIDLLEAQRASLPIEEVRTAFLADKADLYSDLVVSTLDTGDDAGAFDIVERARSRALLERLAASMGSQVESVDPELASQRDAVRRRVHWLYSQLLGEGQGGPAVAEMRSRLQQEEASLRALEWQSAGALQQAEPARLAAFQAALSADQQAVVYFFAGAEVMAFVVTSDGEKVSRRLGSVEEIDAALADLRFQLGRVEMGAAYLERHAARLMQRLRSVLHRLYEQLLSPLRAQLTRPRLLVIPYGALHLLPFHALWDGSHYLVESYEVSYAPSATLAIHCMHEGRQGDGYHVFAGLAIEDPSIPAVGREVILAARHFASTHLYLDRQATRAGLEEAARLSDVLHIATHGLFRPDNSFFSALKLADGWVDVREVYRLPLTARLVVLSACESGAGTIRGGDEVIGLSRGFMGAGAGNLVVSLWNVHDASAAGFMERFYTHLTTGTKSARPAAALAAAQREAAAASRHPYYWAPFAAIG